ncbi:MAG: 2Fe-2S iron-sulfur cluster binding domain-containing protein [Fibrobacter sp.]|jgi:Na+-transporting NADH:ubiquinone oxidoreductase subunit F|nr:2Fe-2S iron-sulfur cluster binding domain-containing protein [Fibrobacter sp.]
MVKVSINNGKRVLEAKEGEMLIDVLSAQGIHLPSACGSKGNCGLCKLKVVEPEIPFTKHELERLFEDKRNEAFHLSCQISLKQDINIEIPQEYLTSQEYTAKLASRRLLTSDIIELTLELISPASISFNPGQYILIKVPPKEGRKAFMRPFSIASSNADTSFIQLNIRRNPGGICTSWIFDELKQGEVVKFSGPRGNFYMHNTERPMLFIAGGSGMAPVRSILKTMHHFRINRKAIYFFGALSHQDLFYLDEMEKLQKEMDDFRFIPALSNEPEGSSWQGERGLIPEVAERYLTGDVSEYEAYLCGKPAMIQSCISILTIKNIPSERTYFDLFNVAKSQK